MINDEIVSFLRRNGPSLPVEIGKAVGYDSMLTKAVLVELIEKGIVKKSHRPVGGSLIYYLPEQANAMRERLARDLNIPERKVLDELRKRGQVLASELSPHERAFLNRLRDFIIVKKQGNDFMITHYAYTPPVVPKKQFLFQQPVRKVMDFESKVTEFLNLIGKITYSRKIKSGKEYEYEVSTKQPFKQEFFVKAKNKKTINENDLSIVYTEALRRKKPALFITTGKLSRKAEEWKKANVGSIVNVILLKN